jgi:hypothetical protein
VCDHPNDDDINAIVIVPAAGSLGCIYLSRRPELGRHRKSQIRPCLKQQQREEKHDDGAVGAGIA